MSYREIHTDESGNQFTAETFLAYLSPTNSCWWTGEKQAYFFRGQSNASWTLIPSAFRKDAPKGFKDLVEYFENNLSTAQPTRYNIRALAKMQALYDFAKLCHDSGLRSFPQIERGGLPQNVLPGSTHYSGRICIFDNNSDAELRERINFLGLAQHHGIPTQLLDWTRNSIFASHFATRDLFQSEARSGIAVYAIENRLPVGAQLTRNNAIENIEVEFVEPDVNLNSYASSQKGLFTAFRYPNSPEVFF